MLPDLKPDFSRSLARAGDRLYFTAHSHHFWPDVSRDAHMQAWDDAAELAGGKWGRVFGVIANARSRIARVLSLPDPETICFAPSTHDFVLRLLSCLPAGRPVKILTTDGEFHSFSRQVKRLEQDGLAAVTRIPVEPFASFQSRFMAAALAGGYDMVFLSHVFYNSGFVVPDLGGIVSTVKDEKTFIAIDAYHGFMALPTDLSTIAARAFYIAGGYKYAMSGEGACFMHCPPGYGPAPRDTGWFADIDNLDSPKSPDVHYGRDGTRFMGATFDPSGIYRLEAVLGWLEEKGITVNDIRAHVVALQKQFAAGVAPPLLPVDGKSHGNFLTFRLKNVKETHDKLTQKDVITDFRGDRLRFGFGLWHDTADVAALLERIRGIDGIS